MNLNFNLQFKDIKEFVAYWSVKYTYDDINYTKNIGKPLTQQSRIELFQWKNGGKLSQSKFKSIENNYPLEFPNDMPQRYLNHKLGGGAIGECQGSCRLNLKKNNVFWHPSYQPKSSLHFF